VPQSNAGDGFGPGALPRPSGARSSESPPTLAAAMGGAGGNDWGEAWCPWPLAAHPVADRITARTRIHVFVHRGPQARLSIYMSAQICSGRSAGSETTLVELKGIHARKPEDRRSSARGWGAHSRSAPAGRRTKPKRPLKIDPAIAAVTGAQSSPPPAAAGQVIVWLSSHIDQHPGRRCRGRWHRSCARGFPAIQARQGLR